MWRSLSTWEVLAFTDPFLPWNLTEKIQALNHVA